MSSKHNNYLSDDEKKVILEKHKLGYSSVSIANELGRSDSTIGRFLKKNGLKSTNMKNNMLHSEIDDIVNMYESGMTAQEIFQKYKDKISCEETIINIVQRNGVKIRPRGFGASGNTSYFHTIDTEAKAYYLGLFLTDGNVFKYKRNTDQYRVQIMLHSKDVDIIEKFKNEIKSNNKITHYKTDNKDECGFSINSCEMANDLRMYGVHERKTFNAKLTDLIPKHLYRHYIRGVFDGDGTVFIKNNNQLIFGFYGTHELVNQVKQYLVDEIGINNNSIFDKETVSFVTFSRKQDVINFYKLIYDNASFYLSRKKNKFEQYFDIKNITV